VGFWNTIEITICIGTQIQRKCREDATDPYSADLQKHIQDWPSRYHLSYRRTNLLEAVKSLIRKEWEVLELGAGTGVITVWLGKNCARVDAVEGAFSRARAARLRTRGMKNVRIIVGDIANMAFPQKYHLITLIGVLEYVPYYSSDGDPREACAKFLTGILPYLHEDGMLLIALENKLGAKYFSGCREDHNGQLFSGIMDYP
jgi:SAM-dependent methyltransferase